MLVRTKEPSACEEIQSRKKAEFTGQRVSACPQMLGGAGYDPSCRPIGLSTAREHALCPAAQDCHVPRATGAIRLAIMVYSTRLYSQQKNHGLGLASGLGAPRVYGENGGDIKHVAKKSTWRTEVRDLLEGEGERLLDNQIVRFRLGNETKIWRPTPSLIHPQTGTARPP